MTDRNLIYPGKDPDFTFPEEGSDMPTNSAYTPGPWEAQDTEMGLDVISKDWRIAALYDLPNVKQANARLIAAAPDMLETLKAIEPWLNSASQDTLIIERVRSVIAKAQP